MIDPQMTKRLTALRNYRGLIGQARERVLYPPSVTEAFQATAELDDLYARFALMFDELDQQLSMGTAGLPLQWKRHGELTARQPYTVVGLWLDDQRVIVAVYAGHLPAVDTSDDARRFGELVWAKDPDDAERIVREMKEDD